MSIRWKLLILLLAIALVPLVIVSCFRKAALQHLADEFGAEARATLIDDAGEQLRHLSREYLDSIRGEAQVIELLLRWQAREVERALAGPPPTDVGPIYWAAEFDSAPDTIPGLQTATASTSSATAPTPATACTTEHPVFLHAPGVDPNTLADGIARLASLLPVDQLVFSTDALALQWTYTALASGVHCAFPGHGGYPADYDPRTRPWYRLALEWDGLAWTTPMVDASTGDVVLTVAMPVRNPAGEIAGVTAMDVRLRHLVHRVKIPAAWASDAQSMVIVPWRMKDWDRERLLIVAQRAYLTHARAWDQRVEVAALEADDPADTAALMTAVKAGENGIQEVTVAGVPTLWAYAAGPNALAVLLAVPDSAIIGAAEAAEAHVVARIRLLDRVAGGALVLMAVTVIVAALRASRSVTKPVADLVDAAHRIAAGDFSTRVAVRSRDELGDLGRSVNRMIPQLEDRLRMRHSLALAMHVQQRLLPAAAPTIPGLDIAGHSIYCDETGGDYFDFLDISEVAPGRVGVAVGDVTGHGIAAALLMATGRALLRSHADNATSLADMLDAVNRQLAGDTDAERFMTLVYLLIDAEARTFRWASAGHDPPIIYDPRAQAFIELDGGGIPLGVYDDWSYEQNDGPPLTDNLVIVLGTDGIWEALNARREMFGKDALRACVREHAHQTAAEISNAITAAVAEFRGAAPQEDDLTLVVIKVTPRDSEAASA
jgi:sigma-B regulation protein RsbU (phosphoserine phosphatase)